MVSAIFFGAVGFVPDNADYCRKQRAKRAEQNFEIFKLHDCSFLYAKISLGLVWCAVRHPALCAVAMNAWQAVRALRQGTGNRIEAVIIAAGSGWPPFLHLGYKGRFKNAAMHVKAARGQNRVKAFEDAQLFILGLVFFQNLCTCMVFSQRVPQDFRQELTDAIGFYRQARQVMRLGDFGRPLRIAGWLRRFLRLYRF